MAKTTPTAYLAPTLLDITPSAPVRDDTWSGHTQRLHYLYSRAGERIPLFDGDEVSTTSTGFARPGELDGIVGVWRARREVSGGDFLLDLSAYGEDIVIRATVYDVIGGVTVDTFDLTIAGGPVWASTTYTGLAADVLFGGAPTILGVDVQIRANATEAKLYQLFAHATFLSSAQIP